ncbi:MAG TPA: TonB-dependent receptor, partial [Segetibacter sp.]
TNFSSRLSNKLQVGYTALRDFRSPHSASTTFPLVDILNGSGQIYTTFGYEPYTYNNILNTDVYQLSDILTLYKGTHEITVGTQNYYRKYQNAFAPGYLGSYQFSSLTDFYNSVNNGTANARNFYQQYSALPKGEFPFAYAGSTELGFFAQDKWRPTSNFTLTYGLRVDATIYKQAFTDNPIFDTLKFANGAQYNIGKAPKTTPLISPRLGFNWDVVGDKTFQVRGGFGIFSGPPPFVWISNQASNNGIQFGSFTRPNDAFNANPAPPTAGAPNSSYSVALTSNNFKYPTVIKSSLAVDKKFGKDFIVTLEGTYNKDINAVYYSNLNLKESNGFALAGADNRTRYLTTVANSNKYYAGSTLANPNIGTAILMDNTNKGYGYNATLRLQKTFKNLYASVAYTRSVAKNTAEFGSTASSLWSARAVSSDPNADNLAYASYYQPHRVIAMASYRVAYAKYFATSVGLIFEAAPAGTTSYVYNGDLNGDNNPSNDLIYIPNSQSEINLVKVNSGGSGNGSGTATAPVTENRSSAQIWAQLNNFINQDHYLAFHRGKYAKANAVLYPFFKKLDVNITQDISVKTGKERHTLRISMDLINAGNFLNRNWGIVKTPVITNFLKYEGLAADGKTPSFSFPYIDDKNQVPLTNSFQNNTSITSRWQMQIGVKYLFN